MPKSKTKAKSSKPSEKWKLVGKRQECPKCGKGVYMGEYKKPDRLHCGKWSYTEFKSTK